MASICSGPPHLSPPKPLPLSMEHCFMISHKFHQPGLLTLLLRIVLLSNDCFKCGVFEHFLALENFYTSYIKHSDRDWLYELDKIVSLLLNFHKPISKYYLVNSIQSNFSFVQYWFSQMEIEMEIDFGMLLTFSLTRFPSVIICRLPWFSSSIKYSF